MGFDPSGTVVQSGGGIEVSSGAIVSDLTVQSGGVVDLLGGGVTGFTPVSGAIVYNGLILNGGKVTGAVLTAGMMQVISSGGEALNTTVERYGSQVVNSGGSAVGVIIQSGGGESVFGVASNVTIQSGGMESISFHDNGEGFVSNVTIDSGGYVDLINAGILDEATIYGVLNESYANSYETTISRGGVEIVGSYSVANSVKIDTGGTLVYAGGSAVAANFQGGTYAGVASGTVVTSLDVSSGEMLFVSAGGIVDGLAISSYASASLLSGGLALGKVTFGPNNASFTVASGGTLSAVLSNFASTDSVTLGAITYGAETSFTYSGTAASGTLTVTDGTNVGAVQFVGNYSSAGFHDRAALGGGTVITYG